MDIIDCHMHIFQEPPEGGDWKVWRDRFLTAGVTRVVAMGAGEVGVEEKLAPPMIPPAANLAAWPEAVYCAGVDYNRLHAGNLDESLRLFEVALADRRCVGIKLYAGYHPVYPADPLNHGFFELARQFDLPVVIHSGATVKGHGLLKYAHPLKIDEAATLFPDVRIVIAHFGDPWLVDAAAVAAKNDNVFIDLSGLASGEFELTDFRRRYAGYLEQLRTWMAYLSDDHKFLYGSDWPLVDPALYIALMKELVPEESHERFFFRNAFDVFKRLELK